MITELNRLHKIVATRPTGKVAAKSSDADNLLFGVLVAIFKASKALVKNPIAVLMILSIIAAGVSAYQPTVCTFNSPITNDNRVAAQSAMGQANWELWNIVPPANRTLVAIPTVSNSSLPFVTMNHAIQWGDQLCPGVSNVEQEVGGVASIYQAMKTVAGEFSPQFEAAVASLDVQGIVNAIANGKHVSINTPLPTQDPTPGPTPSPSSLNITISPTPLPTNPPSSAPSSPAPTSAPSSSAPSPQPTPPPSGYVVTINGEYFCSVAGKQLKQMGCKDPDFRNLYNDFYKSCDGIYSLSNDCAVTVAKPTASANLRSVPLSSEAKSPIHFGVLGEIANTASNAAEEVVSPLKADVSTDRKWIDGTAGVVGLVFALALAAGSKRHLEINRLKALANESLQLMPEQRGTNLVSREEGKVFSGDPAKGFKEDRFAKAHEVTPKLIHDSCAPEDKIHFEQTLSTLTDSVIGKMDWTGANGSYKEGAARAVVIGLLSKIHQLLSVAPDRVMDGDDDLGPRDPRNFRRPIVLPTGGRTDADGFRRSDTILDILSHAVNLVERTGGTDWATSLGQKPAYDLSKAIEYLKSRLTFSTDRGIALNDVVILPVEESV